MSFETAVEFVLSKEGGLSDDPEDPGGLTQWGISQRSYPKLDIRNLTRDEAKEIYRRDYWDKCRCEELPPGLDLLVFDSAVNQGPRAAIQMLQDAVRTTPDGVLGPLTMAAVRKVAPESLCVEFASQRMEAYGRNPKFLRFGLGWSRRLISCVFAALKG